MAPKTRSSPKTPASTKTKAKKPRKVGLKRKRKPSEDEASEDQSHSEQNDSDEDNINACSNEENYYGKFQKYNKDKLWKLKKIAHHLLPSFNFTKFTDLNDVRNLPLVQISLPHSLYVDSRLSEKIDICHRRTIALNSHMSRLKTLKSFYSSKKKNKSTRKDEKKGVYCQAMLDYTKLRELNPDKYFMEDYDFYYTGGNLSINKRSSQIAHVAGRDLSTLVVSVLNVHNNIPKVHKLTSADFNNGNTDSEIFEVQFSLNADNFLFMRQKHCVSVQDFSNSKLNVIQNFRTKDVPFISFTQDIVNNHHLAISDLIHKVRLCDIENGVPIQTLRMMPRDEIKPANNWNMIKSFGSHVYIYSMRKKVTMIDTRLPESEWQSNYCATVIDDPSCYSFCSLARSKFENLFYVASSHKAYCIDRRYMGKDVESRNSTVATWTHQTSTFPLMMATCSFKNVEYIALQSPLNSDLRICENMQFTQEPQPEPGTSKAKKARTDLPPEYSYKSPCLPYMPQSLESVFQQGRLNGEGIKQGTGLCDRVKACITGLDFTDDILCPYLITATSNGDVFGRQICNTDDDVKPDTVTAGEVIHKFEENIFRSVRKNPITVTNVRNMAGISKVFRCPLLDSDNKKEDPILLKRKYGGRWQKSIQSLSKYKDALAADLISIWDFEIDEEKDLNIVSLNNTEMSELKVSGWLENTPDMAHSTMLNMTSIPMDVFNASNLNSTLGDNSFNNIEPTESKLPIELNQSATVKPKTAKKKTRYIKGF